MLTESYNNVLKDSKANKAQDAKDSVVIGDPRIDTSFQPEQKGKRKQQGEVMTSFKSGINPNAIAHG